MYPCIYKYTGGLVGGCIGAPIIYRWTGRWMYWCIYKYTGGLVGGCIGASINIQVDW